MSKVLVLFLSLFAIPACKTTTVESDTSAVSLKSRVVLRPIQANECIVHWAALDSSGFVVSRRIDETFPKTTISASEAHKKVLYRVFDDKYQPRTDSPAYAKFGDWFTADETELCSNTYHQAYFDHVVAITSVAINEHPKYSCNVDLEIEVRRASGGSGSRHSGKSSGRCNREDIETALDDAFSKITSVPL